MSQNLQGMNSGTKIMKGQSKFNLKFKNLFFKQGQGCLMDLTTKQKDQVVPRRQEREQILSFGWADSRIQSDDHFSSSQHRISKFYGSARSSEVPIIRKIANIDQSILYLIQKNVRPKSESLSLTEIEQIILGLEDHNQVYKLIQSIEILFRHNIEDYNKVKSYLQRHKIGAALLDNVVEEFKSLCKQDNAESEQLLRDIVAEDCVLALKLVYDMNNQLVSPSTTTTMDTSYCESDMDYERIDNSSSSLVEAIAKFKTNKHSSYAASTNVRASGSNQLLMGEMVRMLMAHLGVQVSK